MDLLLDEKLTTDTIQVIDFPEKSLRASAINIDSGQNYLPIPIKQLHVNGVIDPPDKNSASDNTTSKLSYPWWTFSRGNKSVYKLQKSDWVNVSLCEEARVKKGVRRGVERPFDQDQTVLEQLHDSYHSERVNHRRSGELWRAGNLPKRGGSENLWGRRVQVTM